MTVLDPTNLDQTTIPRARDFELGAGFAVVVEVQTYTNAGDILDLTDADDLEWIVQKAWDDTTGLVTKTKGNGITILEPKTDGKFRIDISAAELASAPGTSEYVDWYHRASMTKAGKEYLLLVGNVRIWNIA